MSALESEVDEVEEVEAPKIKAAQFWASNAELIADAARLGYIKPDDRVLDPTYGGGIWWKRVRPSHLVTHDIAIDGVDFRHLPYKDGMFDVVAFDPPYVSAGGRTTTTLPDFYRRYGLTDAPKSPAELQLLINDGLTEANRVLGRKKLAIVKVQNYISSGQFWNGTYYTEKHAIEVLGMTVVDRFEHLSKGGRAQPKHARQVHARRNLSTLFVFKKA